MTAPPGGPHGPNPYDPNPYDPYGQNPGWGQPPQGGQPGYPPPYGVDPYAQTQYAPTSPPPGGYPPPQYPGGGYPPPGGGGGEPPPPPPPSKTPMVIGIVAGVLVVAILAVTAVFALRDDGDDTAAGPTTPELSTSPPVSMTPQSPTSTPTSAPSTSPSSKSDGKQNATDCTANVSGGELTGDQARAGALGFPVSLAPGWQAIADTNVPNGIGVVGVARPVPTAKDWMMEAVVGESNLVASMDITEQASKLLTCVADGPGYDGADPTLNTPKTSKVTVDGVDAARVDADVTIGDATRGLPGDVVTVIAVKTEPVTFFLATHPIGDAASQSAVDAIIAGLTVERG